MKDLLFCGLAALALLAVGCDAENGIVNNNDEIEPSDVEDAEVPVGQEVTLKGEVSEVYDERTFSLSDEGISFDDDLIVVSGEPLPFKADDDATVQVTGEVARYSVVEVEREYDWDFDPQVEIELEDTEYYLKNAQISVIEQED